MGDALLPEQRRELGDPFKLMKTLLVQLNGAGEDTLAAACARGRAECDAMPASERYGMWCIKARAAELRLLENEMRSHRGTAVVPLFNAVPGTKTEMVRLVMKDQPAMTFAEVGRAVRSRFGVELGISKYSLVRQVAQAVDRSAFRATRWALKTAAALLLVCCHLAAFARPVPALLSSKYQSPKAAAATATAVPVLAAPASLTSAARLAPGVFTVSAPGQQARITLAWNPSPDASVVGYRLYYGPAFANYTNSVRVGNVTNATLSGLPEGARLYFTATAVDAAGVESVFSNVVTNDLPWFVGLRPAADYVEGYGRAGATNIIEASTNLTTWTALKTFVGTGQLTNAIWWRSNAPAAWFRIRTR